MFYDVIFFKCRCIFNDRADFLRKLYDLCFKTISLLLTVTWTSGGLGKHAPFAIRCGHGISIPKITESNLLSLQEHEDAVDTYEVISAANLDSGIVR